MNAHPIAYALWLTGLVLAGGRTPAETPPSLFTPHSILNRTEASSPEQDWFELTFTPATAPTLPPPERSRPPLTPGELEAAGAYATALFLGHSQNLPSPPPTLASHPAAVFLAARLQGRRLAHVWRLHAQGSEALRQAAVDLFQSLEPDQRTAVTHLEINLGHSFSPVDPQDAERLANIHRGRLGLELIADTRRWFMAPTEMIAQNLSFDRAIDRLAQRAEVPRASLGTPTRRLRLFEADQLLVDLRTTPPVITPMHRGNTLETVDSITLTSLRRLADAQSTWMWNNLQPDGRMVYLYWPSRGEESTANNEIRQWMATVALGRLAQQSPDPLLQNRHTSNVLHNLNRSYREDAAGHGEIVENGTTVKLGALALACLALVEHPQRHLFARQESALLRTIDALWQDHGEFRTFWRPAHRTDLVNFYPGEALLLWATLHQQSRDPALRERLLRSIRFYRDWHRQNRNPAFIPWHTQAAFRLWETHPTEELRNWIFEMNDWLLDVQQWDEQRAFPDTMGRFHDPNRPFGPPHASSTGVYMEGLVDAWRLARSVGDTTPSRSLPTHSPTRRPQSHPKHLPR
jgi:hypothetical protein